MSSAIPRLRAPEVIFGTERYIPAWQPPVYTDAALDREVRHDGKPLGFRLRDVLEDRRWAVDATTGETIAPHVFIEQYKAFKSYYVDGGQLKPITRDNYDINLLAIPNVRDFVSVAYDHAGFEVAIGFNEFAKPPSVKESEVRVYNANGEALAQAVQAASLRAELAVLKRLKLAGNLTAEEYATQVDALTDGPAAASAPSEPPVGFAAVEESPADLAARTARCGKTCGSKAGRMAHERNCEVCTPNAASEPEVA